MFGGKLRPGALVDDFLHAHRSGGLGLNNSFCGADVCKPKARKCGDFWAGFEPRPGSLQVLCFWVRDFTRVLAKCSMHLKNCRRLGDL